jgi:uncharacterized circularly permuted ATP-grasp superfamily protein
MGKAAFDEMRTELNVLRAPYRALDDWLEAATAADFAAKAQEAERLFRRIGITFAVYGEGGDPERLIPFDVVPRIIAADEWLRLEIGLKQRVTALNAFLGDVYGAREIMKAGIVPEAMVLENPAYEAIMQGHVLPGGVYTHVAGIDIVRTSANDFYVLEDNCRTPSGVSYMLENRAVMMRLFPEMFRAANVAPISHYPNRLLRMLRSVAPANCNGEPNVVVLTPGQYNSAYYEHSFLADEMGVNLCEGVDLVVEDDVVFMRTTRGLQRVDVIYRRIDDAFLDPLAFRPDSALGVPGLMRAYLKGNVNIANGVGAGIADDKAIYCYVPDMIRFYLGEEPILNNVPTWRCARADERAYVLENLADLVVKETRGSGGYGMLIGPKATKQERAEFAAKIKAAPDNYIAQPTLSLSTAQTFVNEGLAPRHLDLRPFVLVGAQGIEIVPGGLTRVALREGSLVVNSSQGGGTKDTWVLRAEANGAQISASSQSQSQTAAMKGD